MFFFSLNKETHLDIIILHLYYYFKSWWHDLQFLRYRVWRTETGNYGSFFAFLHPMEWGRLNFLSFWAIFSILPPPPLTTQKIKILKKWKKASRDTIIQYTWCVPKIMIIWCMLPEIWSVTHNFLSFWAILFPFVSLKTLKIEIWKNIKKTWRYYPFTHVYHKWRSYDVSFLKYKAWERVFLSFWTIFCTLTLTTQKIKIL